MKYRTKVTVVSKGKSYGPGSILPEDISNVDMDFLKKKGFIEPADVETAAYDDLDDLIDPEDEESFEGFHEVEPGNLKSPDEIRKIRSKKEVAAYAMAIGFELGENYEEKSLKDLQTAVIDFQEEQMEDSEEE